MSIQVKKHVYTFQRITGVSELSVLFSHCTWYIAYLTILEALPILEFMITVDIIHNYFIFNPQLFHFQSGAHVIHKIHH